MKSLFIILFICLALSSFSQTASQYDNILLTTANDFRNAEPQVSLAADFVYSTPIDKKNQHRKDAISFILRWMSGTSDYSFIPDKALSKITANDQDLMSVYLVCMAKYALLKGKGVDRDDLKLNAYMLFATYVENPNNNYKTRGEMKRMTDAYDQGKLQEYLDNKK